MFPNLISAWNTYSPGTGERGIDFVVANPADPYPVNQYDTIHIHVKVSKRWNNG